MTGKQLVLQIENLYSDLNKEADRAGKQIKLPTFIMLAEFIDEQERQELAQESKISNWFLRPIELRTLEQILRKE